jgi:basic membrane protein A
MIKRVESSTKYALDAVAKNTFNSGVVLLVMAADGVGYSAANPELSATVVEKLEALKADIISGKIKVIGTYKEALAAGIAPAGLGAKDN